LKLKAYIRHARAADVIRGLIRAGFSKLAIFDVKSKLKSLGNTEQDYSIELEEEIITETKLELVCDDCDEAEVVKIIRKYGRTSQEDSGWIYIYIYIFQVLTLLILSIINHK
jgi:nitrogen regulatory protein P-II 1